jgi:kynurenine formamidase
LLFARGNEEASFFHGHLISAFVLFSLDNVTIDRFKEEENLAKRRQTLLSAGVCILKDCALAGVPTSEYKLLCQPLLKYKGDAGRCRAILRPVK